MGIEVKVGKTILLDTNCFIYYFEDNPKYSYKLEKIFTDIQRGKNKAFFSIISFMEILVKPKKDKNVFIENRYKMMLTNYPNLTIVNIGYEIADIAARLRACYNVKTPDAIIIATGIAINADYIITNDVRLKGICSKEGIQAVTIEDIEI
jgi:predicted nucleic acid-binding protein